MTRTEDEYLPKNKRIEKIKNELNPNERIILIANHINAGGGEGAEVVYALRNNDTLSKNILKGIEEEGQIPRKIYQRRLPENPNLDYYYILRETGQNTEPVLVEYGFIDNKNDSEKLRNNLLNYVEGAVKGIANYLNIPYSKEPVIDNDTLDDTYIVKKGDTLYSISKLTNIPIDNLVEINNLTSNTLSIGQILKLKEDSNKKYNKYIVQKGDSLWSISRKYNMTVPELIEINNLKSSIIKEGQELLVTKKEIEDNNIYVVQSGDTLWSISKKLNIPVTKIKDLNNLSNNLILVNQKLIIS